MADLVTRCPACRTAFRVVQDQLRLRDGRVRCGVCNHVFDARAEEVAFDPRDVSAGIERQRVPAPGEAPAAPWRPVPPPAGNAPAAPSRPTFQGADVWQSDFGRPTGERPEPRSAVEAQPRVPPGRADGAPLAAPGQGLPPFVARRPEATRSSLESRGAPVAPRTSPGFVARAPRVQPQPQPPGRGELAPGSGSVAGRGESGTRRSDPRTEPDASGWRDEPAMRRDAPVMARRDEPLVRQGARAGASDARGEPVLGRRETPVTAQRAEPVLGGARRAPASDGRDEPVLGRREAPVMAQRDEPVLSGTTRSRGSGRRDEPVLGRRETPVVAQRDEPVVGGFVRETPSSASRAEPVIAAATASRAAAAVRDEPVVARTSPSPTAASRRHEPPLGRDVDDDDVDAHDESHGHDAAQVPMPPRREPAPASTRFTADADDTAADEDGEDDTPRDPAFAAGPGDGWHTPMVAARRRRDSGLGRRLLLGGCVLALVALVFQAAWWWRTPLATYAPGTRPALETMCRLFGCTVDYVRAPRQLSIESSSVQPDTSQPGGDLVQRLTLTAVLRNRAAHDQPWPSLELSLTDFSDTVIMRRVVPPEGYLGQAGVNGAFAAGSEQRIALGISARGAPITGYRLALFFP